jgi:hypothetical protein
LDRNQILKDRTVIVTDAARSKGQAEARLGCSFSARALLADICDDDAKDIGSRARGWVPGNSDIVMAQHQG